MDGFGWITKVDFLEVEDLEVEWRSGNGLAQHEPRQER